MARLGMQDNAEWNDTELTMMALDIMHDLNEMSTKGNVDPSDSFLQHLETEHDHEHSHDTYAAIMHPLHHDLDDYEPSLAIRKHSSITAFYPDPNTGTQAINPLPSALQLQAGGHSLNPSHSEQSAHTLPPLPDSTVSHKVSLPPIRSPEDHPVHNPFAMQYAIEPAHALNLSRHIEPSPIAPRPQLHLHPHPHPLQLHLHRPPSPHCISPHKRRHVKVSPVSRFGDRHRRLLNSPSLNICTPPTSEVHRDSESMLSSVSTLQTSEVGGDSLALTPSMDHPEALRLFPSYSGRDHERSLDPVPTATVPSGASGTGLTGMTASNSMFSRSPHSPDHPIFGCISPRAPTAKVNASSTIPDFVAAARSPRKSKPSKPLPLRNVPAVQVSGLSIEGTPRIKRPPSPLPFRNRPKLRISDPVGLPLIRTADLDHEPLPKHDRKQREHAPPAAAQPPPARRLRRRVDALQSRETTASPGGPLPYFVKRDRNPFVPKSPGSFALDREDGGGGGHRGHRQNGQDPNVEGLQRGRSRNRHGVERTERSRGDAASPSAATAPRRKTLNTKSKSPRRGKITRSKSPRNGGKQWSRTPQPQRKRKQNAAIISKSATRGVIQRRTITPLTFHDLKSGRSGSKLEKTISSPVIGKGPRKYRKGRRNRTGKDRMAQSAKYLGVTAHDEYMVSSDEGDFIYYVQPDPDLEF